LRDILFVNQPKAKQFTFHDPAHLLVIFGQGIAGQQHFHGFALDPQHGIVNVFLTFGEASVDRYAERVRSAL
jgi:hypothetical protein